MNQRKKTVRDIMDIKMAKFEKTVSGWEIAFQVILTSEESLNCNMDTLEHVGDYDIKKYNEMISFNCNFDEGELRQNETIEERLDLIKKDIKHMAKSCFNG